MTKYKHNITGERFGNLIAIEKIGLKNGHAIWKFKCDCGNTVYIAKYNVIRGKTHCGCLDKSRENRTCDVCGSENKVTLRFGRLLCHKHNLQMSRYGKTFRTVYDPNEFHFYCNECHILMYNKNGDLKDVCIIDREDYTKVKNMKWYISCGYPTTKYFDGFSTRISRYLLNYNGENHIDHSNGNILDNRKCNLRIATSNQNAANQQKKVRNCKLIGVNYNKWNGDFKWIPKIMVNYKNIWLGAYDDKEEAIKARLVAENKYFGEFAPQKHLFEKYGIV